MFLDFHSSPIDLYYHMLLFSFDYCSFVVGFVPLFRSLSPGYGQVHYW